MEGELRISKERVCYWICLSAGFLKELYIDFDVIS